MAVQNRTIACFGATGGCVSATLACALRAGYLCTGLARSAEKLRNILSTDHDISSSTIEQYLTIIQGDVKDAAAVRKTLTSPVAPGTAVGVIVSGLGAYPTFQWSIRRPFPLTDPTICETAVRTIFSALCDLGGDRKPLLVAVSTAGCGRVRGIPLSIYLPYHYLLGGPLADKIRMEQVILEDKGQHVRDFVLMRPPFLTDGEPRGAGNFRVGWVWGLEDREKETGAPGIEIGWSIGRRDVGAWMFEEAIVKGGWEGRCVYTVY